MGKKLSYGIYRIIRWFVWLFYPKITVTGLENLPEEPCIVVANHTQMNGPIACQLYFPGKRRIWCAGEMMHLKEVPAYAFQDFWRDKPRYSRWFYKLLSYFIAPFSVCVFNHADTIAVYKDTRIISTFKATVKALCDGENIVVFPEHDVPHNHIVMDFQDKFIDIARLYYKRTGKHLQFVPMYIAPALHSMHLGQSVSFRSDAPMDEERLRIKTALMDAITGMACDLPAHRVVPYRNIPRKDYPSNIPAETAYEKAGG